MTTRHTRRAGGALKKVLVALVAIVVLLLGVVGLFGPGIAAAIAPDYVAKSINRTIQGEVALSGVHLGWGAPIRVESLTIRDPSGRDVVKARAEIGTGLWRLITGDLDFGAIKLKADLDLVMDKDGRTNLDEALATRPGAAAAPKPPSPSGPAPAPPAPIRLPPGLKFDFELEPSTLKLAGKEPGLIPGGAIELSGIVGQASYAHAGPFKLILNAQPVVAGRQTEPIALSLSSPQLTNADGTLRVTDAAGEASIVVSLPQVLADTIAARVGLINASGIDPHPATPGGEDGALQLRAALKLENGRFVLAHPSTPPTASWKLPTAMGTGLSAGAVHVVFEQAPTISFSVAQLSLPAAGLLSPSSSGKAGAKIDWRGTAFISNIGISACSGTMALAEDQTPQRFAAESFVLDVRAPDLAQGLRVSGGTRLRLGDGEVGTARLQGEAHGVLDDQGAVRPGLPSSINGFFALDQIPTGMFEPLTRRAGISLAEVVGPRADVKIEALANTDAPGAAGTTSAIPATSISFSFGGEKLTARGGLAITADRIRTSGDGITLNSMAPGPLLTHFIPALKGRLDGQGLAVISVKELDAPVVAGQPELKATRLTAHAAIGGFGFRIPASTSGTADESINLDSLESTLAVAPDTDPKVDIDWRFSRRGNKFAAIGSLALPGLIEWTAPEYPHLAITPGAMRPAGRIELIDAPTDLASLVSANAGAMAQAVIGPKLGGAIEAAPTTGGAGSVLTLRFVGEGIEISGKAALGNQILSIGSDGVTAEMKNPALAANALLKDQGVDFAGNGRATFKVSDASVALPRSGQAFSIAGARAKLHADIGALGATIRPKDGGPASAFALESLASDITLDKGAAALAVNARGAYDGKPMGVDGRMTAAIEKAFGGSAAFDVSRLQELALDGSIKATRVPVAVAAMVAPDKVDLAREFVGETVDLELTATKGASIAFKANAEHLTANGGAMMGSGALKVQPIEARATLTPGGVGAALRAFAPDLKDPPSLAKPVAIALRTQAFDLSIDPKDAAKPLADRIGALTASLKADGDVALSGLKLDDSARRAGVIIRGLEGDVVADQRDASKSRAALRAELLDAADPAATMARVEAGAALSATPLSGQVKLASIDTARVDRWLGKEGLLAEILGDRADVSVAAARSAANAPMSLQADISSPAVKTSLKAENSAAGTRLLEPASIQWTITDRWANKYLFPPGADGGRALTMKGTAPVKLDLQKLAIGPGDAPLRPGVFDLDIAAAIPAIDLASADGVPIRFTGIGAKANAIRDVPGGVQFTLNADQAATSGAAGGGAALLRTSGRVADLADAKGVLTTDRARLTLDAKGAIPTPLIDALAQSDTLYTAVLGPMTTVDLQAQDLSRNSGTFRGSMRSENSDAAIAGSIAGGQFTASAPVQAKLTRITPEASKQLISKLMPLIDNVEKTPEDRPAAINAADFTAPTDHDMTKLNGTVQVDLGTVRFATSNFLGQLLDAAKMRSKGTAGQRIDPFVIHIARGVANYDRFKLPLGEFAIETQGTVDLVNRQIDSMVYIPFFAVSKELSSVINNDLTAKLAKVPIIDNLSMVPVRIRGPLDKPKTEFAADKFIEENLKSAIDKGLDKGLKDVIDKGLNDLLKKKKKP